jgi:hypothetical protein
MRKTTSFLSVTLFQRDSATARPHSSSKTTSSKTAKILRAASGRYYSTLSTLLLGLHHHHLTTSIMKLFSTAHLLLLATLFSLVRSSEHGMRVSHDIVQSMRSYNRRRHGAGSLITITRSPSDEDYLALQYVCVLVLILSFLPILLFF